MNPHSIEGKTPQDFALQLEVWNYQYNEPTDQFFKYVGMGMLVLDSSWRLAFILRALNDRLMTHDAKYISESIEELPWAEAEVFNAYLQLNKPLMLSNPPKILY
jgi:hypothetical protein